MFLAYVRVSTQEQAMSDRTSLKEQERVLRGVAMTKGIDTFDFVLYSDPGISGATPMELRPSGSKLLDDMSKGDIVCASKLDRMFRSALDALKTAEQMKKRGVDLILFDMGGDPVTENGMSKCFFAMAAAFAELERNTISERMRSGKQAKAEKFDGMGHIGMMPRYGYRVIGSGREARLEIEPREQEILDVIKEWKEYSNVIIMEKLAARGFVDRAGHKFRSNQVQRLVQRVFAEQPAS